MMKILNNIKQISKAYTEGIYADTPANRKLGRVGMSYKEYAEKLKGEEDSKKEKKPYYISLPDGEEFMLEESPITQEEMIKLSVQYAEDQINHNNKDKVEFTIYENNDDKEDYDWLSVKAKKYGNKIEISIFDYNKGEFIRNDKLKREKKNLEQQHRRAEKKAEEEFQKKFGWMKELDEYLKSKKDKKIVSEDTKKDIQKELNKLGISSFQLGYGGYQFSGKNSDGNYNKLTISNISERDLYLFTVKLDEMKVKYSIEYKTPSSQQNVIKDLSIKFDNENIQ